MINILFRDGYFEMLKYKMNFLTLKSELSVKKYLTKCDFSFLTDTFANTKETFSLLFSSVSRDKHFTNLKDVSFERALR